LKDNTTSDFDYGTFDKEKYSLVWQYNKWQLYENKQVFPRFFLTPQFVVKTSVSDQVSAFYSQDLAKTIILSENPLMPTDPNATGNVKLTVYTPNKILFTLESSGTQFLFLSDTYYHNWIAKIDGTKT